MIKSVITIITALFLVLPLTVHAQGFGEHLTLQLRKSILEVKSDFGNDFSESNKDLVKSYIFKPVLSDKGYVLRPITFFYFVNDKVAVVGQVIADDEVGYWRKQFQTYLVHDKDAFWKNPTDKSIWGLKSQNDLWIVSVADPELSKLMGQPRIRFSQATRDELIDKCVNGNPANRGNEAYIKPVCTCFIETLEERYTEADLRRGVVNADVVLRLSEECAEKTGFTQNADNLKYSNWEVMQSVYVRECIKGSTAAEITRKHQQCVCQFNYLKAKCHSITDFENLTLKEVADATEHCTR